MKLFQWLRDRRKYKYFMLFVFFTEFLSILYLQFLFFFFLPSNSIAFVWLYTWVLNWHHSRHEVHCSTLLLYSRSRRKKIWKLFISIANKLRWLSYERDVLWRKKKKRKKRLNLHNLLCFEKQCVQRNGLNSPFDSIYFSRYLRQTSKQVANGNWRTSSV